MTFRQRAFLVIGVLCVYACTLFADTTRLFSALTNKNADDVTNTVFAGASLTATNEKGMTPLMVACSFCDAPIIRFLIESGADVNVRDPKGATPLLIACAVGDYVTVSTLVKAGADVNACDTNGTTPLMVAALFGGRAVTELLIQNGAEIDAQDNDGKTALMFVATVGNYEVMNLLLQEGADVNCRTPEGCSAIDDAVAAGHTNMVTILRDHQGAAPEGVVADFFTAACMNDTNTLRRLLHYGMDVDVYNSEGWTPLALAAVRGYIDTVAFLVAHGADVNLRVHGMNALMHALAHERTECVFYLMSAGASLDDEKRGWNASRIARYTGNETIINYLRRSDYLIDAVKRHNTLRVHSLLQQGASPDDKGEEGKSAREVALALGFEDIIMIFDDYEPPFIDYTDRVVTNITVFIAGITTNDDGNVEATVVVDAENRSLTQLTKGNFSLFAVEENATGRNAFRYIPFARFGLTISLEDPPNAPKGYVISWAKEEPAPRYRLTTTYVSGKGYVEHVTYLDLADHLKSETEGE